jgi:tRNA-specific adenosine deaminase 2
MTPAVTSTAKDHGVDVKLNGKAAAAVNAQDLPLIDLYSGSQASMAITDATLRKEIIKGLRGAETYIVPGSVDSVEDRKFAFRRTLPTTILYSERGLLLYDKLVEAPEYYLWNAEIDILTRHAKEIAQRAFGHKTYKEEQKDEQPYRKQQNDFPPKNQLDATKERWGDEQVGIHNGGVNAEEGLDGDHAIGAASLVELGAGSLRKTVHLIRALQHVAESPDHQSKDGQSPSVQYYALDLDKAELVRTLQELHKQEARASDAHSWSVLDQNVGINGMWATYDQGLEFIGAGGLADTKAGDGKRCLLWLGSSIGNFDRRGAAEFLERAAKSSLRAGDTMLVSVDRRNKPEDVAAAYNDAAGLTRDFIVQGLKHADTILGGGILDASKFEYFDRYNAIEGRHESYYRALQDVAIEIPADQESKAERIEISAGELIHVESSYKYNEREALDIFDYAGLRILNQWTDKDDRYDIYLVERPLFHFCSTRLLTGSRHDIGQGLSPAQANGKRGSWEYDSDAGAGSNSIKEPLLHASWGLPSLKDWDELWKAWDCVTLTMIDKSMLHEKPIDLRHICLFYIGHIPAFLDIMISRTLDLPHTNKHFSDIFERGIDPHMDDQTKCNPHSEVPDKEDEWPTLAELLAYKNKVQERVKSIYHEIADGTRKLDRRAARLFWLTLEHKALHLETLLYMLMQSPKTRKPDGFIEPDWEILARHWDQQDERQGGERAREQLLNFKASYVTLGHEDDDSTDLEYVATKQSADVDELNAQLGYPEFGWDIEAPSSNVKTDAFSITAAPINNEQYLNFLIETKSTDYPASWNVDEPENIRVRSFYGPVQMRVARLWPCQASAEQLEKYAVWKGGRLPTHAELRLFLDANSGPNVTDRPGTNVGFRNWHPVPAQLARHDHDGTPLAGHNGGVWEWTSTTLAAPKGFKSSALYPGYSSDFFDGKHNVVLGGSYVTTPSIAGRRTSVNWYQKPYPYVFCGARVVYDANTRSQARMTSPHLALS